MDDLKIFIVSNKIVPFVKTDGYVPILVGAGSKEALPGMYSDAGAKDNISAKNPYYCELTALYYMWKNIPLPKYVGMCHYRRYFKFKDGPVTDLATDSNPKYALELMKDTDIIMLKPRKEEISEIVAYSTVHPVRYMFQCYNVLKRLYPEYEKDFFAVVEGKSMSDCNMFVTRREIFTDYMEWLFRILFMLEKEIEYPGDPFQDRVMGFLAERLMNAYVRHHKFRVNTRPFYVLNHLSLPNSTPLPEK